MTRLPGRYDPRDLLGVYLDEIARTPLLDASKEVELAKTIEAGLFAEHLQEQDELPVRITAKELVQLVKEGERAKDYFIRANLRLVVSIARRYIRVNVPMLDIIQEGNTGLVRAVEKFDYNKGYKFSTYATWWVRQAITRALSPQERSIRLPVHVVEEVNRMHRVERDLRGIDGDEADPGRLAAELGVTLRRLVELQRWSMGTVSLDQPANDDGNATLGDLVVEEDAISPEGLVNALSDRARAERYLGYLSARAQAIVRARLGFDGPIRTLDDVSLDHDLSRERIRQIEKQAYIYLRQIARDEEEIWAA